ncbi:MAG: WYL domain-containing protein [Nostoc sp.]|uniref:helix-turn-helix transcriptional regulator n=1 Tax=Nostoc sp. TaxID=1180 RepID=UPI002FF4B472
MPKKSISHPYTERLSFERLMLLITTLLNNPGIGSPDLINTNHDKQHDALTQVQISLQQLALKSRIELPEDYPAIPTLRKDLETLRRYGILERRMYRWGYYLGTGAMSQTELKVAFNALASQAKFQGDPQLRRICETLSKRLRGLDMELQGKFFYPVRQHLNRAIVYTDPEEMAAQGENRNTLFHLLPLLETAISQGQTIEISRATDLYGNSRIGLLQVVPLQLIYHDIAWYLLYEHSENGHLAIGRLNRFKNYCQLLNNGLGRGLEAQKNSLNKAYQLLENGWGLYLGQPPEQQLELQGQLEFLTVKVRFFPPVTAFIQEGEVRHLKQKIIPGSKNETTGNLNYVDYQITLPPRSIDEFSLWVYRYMHSAQVISPPHLVEKHRQAAHALLSQYAIPLQDA